MSVWFWMQIQICIIFIDTMYIYFQPNFNFGGIYCGSGSTQSFRLSNKVSTIEKNIVCNKVYRIYLWTQFQIKI